jgi:hypothetical protein
MLFLVPPYNKEVIGAIVLVLCKAKVVANLNAFAVKATENTFGHKASTVT